MKIRNLILIILISTNYVLSQNKTAEDNHNSIYIDLEEYNINKQNVVAIPNFDFKHAIIDSDLDFKPNSKNFIDFYKNDSNGNVKQITTYRKSKDDQYKRFESMESFNENGYKIESEYEYAGILKYFYDSNNNLIKEIKIRNDDTITVKNVLYNKENKIINIKKKYLKEKENYEFNLDVTIEYNSDGSPSKIKNKNPNKTYTKEITYVGNKVIITKKSNSKDSTTEILIFSKSYKLLKHNYGSHIIFNTYDENDRIASSKTYRDNEYCCTDFYTYDDKGNQTNWIFTNHLKDHKEIHTYKYNFDNLNNIVYKYATDNVTNKESESFYEIEYYSN